MIAKQTKTINVREKKELTAFLLNQPKKSKKNWKEKAPRCFPQAIGLPKLSLGTPITQRQPLIFVV